ncbi:M24 family metallopeptidase (plasmid) [Deinococcus psychrotolerans]|uniref:M24 family metallopeptidase n=1 Tax=Deinococcus psychrotolerans TaxID=2489213 RepID=A0A3G8YJT4_9DEIO|nr:M24 family metallopeptidase [Deinococcus psychrotolerans]AZI45000.1 M24 family metallopeptidase [Deinococcus psychrotolerans]
MDRLAQLQAALKPAALDALLLTAPYQLRAFCGAQVSAGALVVTPERRVLLLDPRYQQAVKPGKVEIKPYVGIHEYARALRELFGPDAVRIGVYAPALSLADMQTLNPHGDLTFVPADALINELTSLLSSAEIEALQQAEAVTRQAIEVAFAALRPGVTERQLQQLLLSHIYQESEGPSFEPIIAFGSRTALPHAHPGMTALGQNELVTIDAGAVIDGLHADLTVTRLFGQSERAQQLIDLTQQALEAALQAVRPGVTASEVDEAARAPIRAAGLDQHTLRGIGHALGYQTHQFPILREHGQEKLQVGQVLAIEPGVYLPGFGGVRLEKMIVVTETGGRLISEWRSEERAE